MGVITQKARNWFGVRREIRNNNQYQKSPHPTAVKVTYLEENKGKILPSVTL